MYLLSSASSLTKVEHVSCDQGFGPVMKNLRNLWISELLFNDKLPTLLFVGGSAGARVFNLN